jgi:hypothetical protein
MLETITLGELIARLEALPEDRAIEFDFGGAIPTSFNSWRGVYADLALGFGIHGFNGGKIETNETVTGLLKKAKHANGGTYGGYKGGHFTMNKNTPVWVDNYGECTKTAIKGIEEKEYGLKIITEAV